eukprot:TRINITY_DN11760_c1_g1_i4.p1 TRINITY_DN11760_c1_g1~~TRINITY_DN11760_c1_g1_i4.p1  ORF type:complete len:642 (+),score=43.98 TRINITY_DN11760_c1_g1_i4:41-1927(+)
MGSLSGKTLLFFVFIILLVIRIQAGQWNLDTSDSEALWQIQLDLGFHRQRNSKPCNSAGIFCEKRISGNSSVVIRLTGIVFGSRRLAGFLSPAIGRLSELRVLSLPNNDLVDRIPSEIVDCKKLEILNLRSNNFSGSIPEGITSLVSLRFLDLSSNRFSGDLRFLRNFPNLENLSLADNLFTGKVPPSLRSLPNLQFLNLSGNDLQGPVPTGVEYLKNILPKRYIFTENSRKNISIAAIPPSSNSTKGHRASLALAPGPAPHKHRKKKPHIKLWILGFFIGAITGILSGVVCSVLFRMLLNCIRGRAKTTDIKIFSSMIEKAEDLAFLEKEDGLSSLEIIGRGGCGEVYKAELPGSNGKLIAIKKIIQLLNEGGDLTEEDSKLLNKKLRQIRSEINTVGEIRHRNLLPLLAHVPRPDCHYLVYEFMRNGSLQDVLTQVSQGTRELEWPIRHKIAMGIAAGLEYLHHHHSPRVIHRDIKPGNILLDDDLEARIADFGLAKQVPDSDTHMTSSNVAGTLGFIAPEYHQTLKFTDKCDIYSYGVLLAVLVFGKLPSDQFFQTTNEMSLVKWLKNVMISEDPKSAIDPKLLGNGFESQMLLVLKVACFCTSDDPKQRPNSKDVRCMLSQIKY